MTGLDMALEEITLVLFTTLAPAGVAAFVLAGLPVATGRVVDAARDRLDKMAVLPLVVAMVGLVASSTHLGNPANALYVFAGVGRSPLSNEVTCGVVFLALAGIYWLTAFSERPRQKPRTALLVAAMAVGVLFVVAIAFAYSADTIPTWNTPFVPLSLGLCALAGGTLLAALTMRLARCPLVRGAYGLALVMLSGVAAAGATAAFVLQGAVLAETANHLVKASDLVPGYGVAVAAFAVLALGGSVVAAVALHKGRDEASGEAQAPVEAAGQQAESAGEAEQPAASDDAMRWASAPALVLALLLSLAGIFVMRFCFYMSHLTVGLGV